MDQAQIIGYVIMAILELAAFVAVIVKFTQPINELRIVIQKLNDNFESMKATSENHEARLNEHGRELDTLRTDVTKLSTKVDMYHKQ